MIKIQRLKYSILLITICFFNSCRNSSDTPLSNINSQQSNFLSCPWLIGDWINAASTKTITESWRVENDTLLVGASYFIKGKDTLSHESIKIEFKLNKIYYVPTVSNQNGSLPVRFKEKELSDSLIVFENPGHDFPQFISYQLINKDSIVAKIYGQIKGEEQSQVFPYKRMK